MSELKLAKIMNSIFCVDITHYILSFLPPPQDVILEKMYEEYGGLHCECYRPDIDHHYVNHFFDHVNMNVYCEDENDNDRFGLYVDDHGRLTILCIDHWDECCGDWDDVRCHCRSETDPYPSNCQLFVSMCSLTHLKEIRMRCLNFSKTTTIPNQIGSLQNLRVLELDHYSMEHNVKGITGSIPNSLKDLNLWFLNLNGLCLSSADISPILEIATLKTLMLRDIFEENLLCDISDLDFSKLVNLTMIDLYHSFSGSIPESLCHLPKIDSMSIEGDQISGVVPESIFTIDVLNYLHIKGSNMILNFSGKEYTEIEFLHISNISEINGEPPEMYEDFDVYPGKHDEPFEGGRL